MDFTALDPRLAARVGQVMTELASNGEPPPPPSVPADGQSREDWIDDVVRIRNQHDAMAQILAIHMVTVGPEVDTVQDHSILVEGGKITARVYTPSEPGPHPGIVFLHGGAFWLAGGEYGFRLTDDYCKIFAAGLPAVVVNVDYRLAPEAAFPLQLEDSYAGLQWTADHAGELGIDPERIVVMGASSGGNLAAAACLLARARGGPRIAAQVLHVPVLDLTGGSESLRSDPSFAALHELIRLYATDDQRHDPLASPLLEPDLAGLAPAVIVTGEFDPLRDDGRRYVTRLAEAGVNVRHLEYPMLHNIALPETSAQMFAEMIEGIRASA